MRTGFLLEQSIDNSAAILPMRWMGSPRGIHLAYYLYRVVFEFDLGPRAQATHWRPTRWLIRAEKPPPSRIRYLPLGHQTVRGHKRRSKE